MKKSWIVVYIIKPDNMYCPLSHVICDTIEQLQDVILKINQCGYKLIDVNSFTEEDDNT